VALIINRAEGDVAVSYAFSLTNENGILYNMKNTFAPEVIELTMENAGYIDTDLELIKSFKDGDQSSFVELVKKYKDRIYRLVYSIIHDRHEADDITQEVFLKVYFKINKFKENSSFFTWMYSIAVNECRHSLRKRKRTFISLDTPLSDDDAVGLGDILKSCEKDIESQLVEEEQIKLLKTLIDTLPDKYKTIYILRNIDGLSYREISEILSISAEKVRVWLFRAREKMDEKIRALGGN